MRAVCFRIATLSGGRHPRACCPAHASARSRWEEPGSGESRPASQPEQLRHPASIIEKEPSTRCAHPHRGVSPTASIRDLLRPTLPSSTVVRRAMGPRASAVARRLARRRPTTPTYDLSTGPDRNPGRASIEAAANPSRTKELYSLLTARRHASPRPIPASAQRGTLRKIEQGARRAPRDVRGDDAGCAESGAPKGRKSARRRHAGELRRIAKPCGLGRATAPLRSRRVRGFFAGCQWRSSMTVSQRTRRVWLRYLGGELSRSTPMLRCVALPRVGRRGRRRAIARPGFGALGRLRTLRPIRGVAGCSGQ